MDWVNGLWIDGGQWIYRVVGKVWMDGWVNLSVDKWIDRRIDRGMDGWVNGLVDR
jgi:hypothetical protein